MLCTTRLPEERMLACSWFGEMPGLPDDSGDVPQSMVETLELFCDLPEQSYEQFLSTFTHMSTDNVTTGCLKGTEEENKTCFVELKRDGVKMDRKVETEEESENLHYIEALCVLPGEVEEELTPSTPAFCHHTQLDLSSPDMEHRTYTPPRNTDSQSETEEAVPFSLDDTYDYDNVVLSHKYLVKSSNCGSS